MFADVLNLVSCLSIPKILNFSLVHLSYLLSILFNKPLVWGNPFFVSLEPSSVCNLACPQCPTGTGDVMRDKKFLDLNTYRAIVDEIGSTTIILSLYHQGEPLMNTSFAEMVKYASACKIYTVTSTNGHFLTADICRRLVEAGLDRIIVSMDGTNQESYEKYRVKGDLEKVIKGIRLLSEARQGRRKPYIIIQFLVFRHNQDQVTEIKRLGKKLGADRVMIKSVQVEYPESIEEWMPVHSKYRRYRKNAEGEWMLETRLKNRCRRLWQTTVVTSDGLIVPCCFDKLAKYPMGSLGSGTISQIWGNKEYSNFRRRILENRREIGICTNCTEGMGRIYR